MNILIIVKMEYPRIKEVLTCYSYLSVITYNKQLITHKSIRAFNLSAKNLNDKNNKTRENIISAIINDKIPSQYYIIYRWLLLKNSINEYLAVIGNHKPYTNCKCVNKGGRRNKFDFEFTISYCDKEVRIFNVELKSNVETVEKAPQFVSPMKPSQYMTNSYEEYYYDNYLPLLVKQVGLKIPEKQAYMKTIHSTSPIIMKAYQELYYQGCSTSSKFTKNPFHQGFYELSKKLSKESIQSFIQITDLKKEALTDYLQKSQNGKIYMLHKNGNFTLQRINTEDYEIETVEKNSKLCRYDCVSKNGKKIKVLLRWKNGNGIAFPAFQIS